MARWKTKPFEFTDHLKTAEDRAGFLEAVLEEWGDKPEVVAAALGEIAKAEGMAEVAKKSGLSRESLYKTLSGERNPSFGTILKIVAALGLQFHVVARATS